MLVKDVTMKSIGTGYSMEYRSRLKCNFNRYQDEKCEGRGNGYNKRFSGKISE